MRFIFKLLLGMIIFNALLFLFSTTLTDSQSGQEIGDYGYDIDSSSFAWTIVYTGGGITVLTGLASIFTKNIVWFGAGAFMSIIFTLWGIGSMPIQKLFLAYGDTLSIAILNILNIIFGIIATIAVVEIFTNRSSDD